MNRDANPIAATDEIFWSRIRSEYEVTPDFINLENGFFGIPALPVQQAFDRYNKQVNREGPFFMRTRYPQALAAMTESLTRFAGAEEGEVLIVRNATEGMNILIQGYPFRAGDECVCSNQDYDSVCGTLEMMQARGRMTLVQVKLPFHPSSDEEIVSIYESAITPKTRVLLLTHLLHRTGQILPVAKIAAMAKLHGVDVFVDAAHSFAHLDFRAPDLGSDFLVANLHKWLGAPLGVGMLYIKKPRIADIAPLFGDVDCAPDDINRLGHFNTTPPAPVLAIEDAIAFHNRMGSANKEARLRYLKEYWVSQAREMPHIEMMVPAAPDRSCAIASFRVRGKPAQEVAEHLFREHRIFTVATVTDGRDVIRVTPHLYTSTDDLDRFVEALRRIT
jgi:selenocysteine lyase/cysteine desulfurase